LKERGASKALWVIAIVLIIIVIGGAVVIYGIGKGVEEVEKEMKTPAKATVTVSEPMDHDGTASIKVTVEGEKTSYDMSLTGPDGTEVGSGYISETQMADGKQSVWVSMVGMFKSEITPTPGKYSLIVTDFGGNKVHKENFTYSGPSLTVESANLTWNTYEYTQSELDSVTLTVTNNGDLPGYVSGVDVSIDNNEGSSTTEQALVSVGETRSVEANNFIGPSVDSGTHTATFELREGFLGQENIVATFSKTVSVP